MRFTVGLLVVVGVMYFIMACVSIAFVFLHEPEAEADVYINPIRYEYAIGKFQFSDKGMEESTIWMNTRAAEGYRFVDSFRASYYCVILMEMAIVVK